MSETNIFFGTAFPQQTERDKRAGVSDAGQFQPIWKQEARDEQGRRRFHGAFTGGFSAGYYNTVGSKEGWTPSQFVSSRSSRHEQQTARVEDFMDEEDLQELASTKRLVTTDEFDTLGGTEKEIARRRQQVQDTKTSSSELTLLTSSLMNLVTPTRDSTGMKLLRKMGWRPGQGIGPRTQYIPTDCDDDDLSHPQMTLAPKDVPIIDYQAKTNTFGLGYDLVANVPQVAEMRRYRQQQQEQLTQDTGVVNRSSSRKGFGVGVFEDEDEIALYDEDETGSSSIKYHHTLYDDQDDNEASLHTLDKRRRPIYSDERGQQTKKVRCSDGHLPLKGFHVSTKVQQLGNWYPPPKVPSSYTETHIQTVRVDTKKRSTVQQHQEQRQTITVDARGEMLGEKPVEVRSVFDYISSKSKQRLAQAASLAASGTDLTVDESRLQVTLMPKDVARLALQGFIPFGDTPDKQARYRHYLEASVKQHRIESDTENTETTATAATTATTFEIPAGMTYESGMKELDEFMKAARIFRPVSSMMSGRFVTASASQDSATKRFGSGNVEQFSFEGGLKTEEQWKKEKMLREQQIIDEPKPKLSQEAEAAAMNMFGPLTRTVKPFYPNRLVCKRFNVRNPHPDHVQQGSSHRTQAGSTSALNEQAVSSILFPQQSAAGGTSSSSFNSLKLVQTKTDDPALQSIISKPSSRSETENDVAIKHRDQSGGLAAESDSTGRKGQNQQQDNIDDEELTYERPTMDIFKAIFENSGDEDEYISKEEETATKDIQFTVPVGIGKGQTEEDDNEFIGPPPPSDDVQAATTGISTRPAASVSTPSSQAAFRPIFSKPESQNTMIQSEHVVVTPFQPRLSTSTKRQPKRRHVSVYSEPSSSSSGESSDATVAEEKHRKKHSYEKKHRRKSDAKRKKPEKKKKKKKHHRHHHSESEDDERLEHRRRHERSKKVDHNRHEVGSESMNVEKYSDDISLWVEKQTVPRRSRPEDLW